MFGLRRRLPNSDHHRVRSEAGSARHGGSLELGPLRGSDVRPGDGPALPDREGQRMGLEAVVGVLYVAGVPVGPGLVRQGVDIAVQAVPPTGTRQHATPLKSSSRSGSPRVETRLNRLPTPISGRNRSLGRGLAGRATRIHGAAPVGRRCSWCGGPTQGRRRTCSKECREAVRADQDRTQFYASGPDRLRRLRESGVEPVGAAARAQMGLRQSERQRQENEWKAEHPERADPSITSRSCSVRVGMDGVLDRAVTKLALARRQVR